MGDQCSHDGAAEKKIFLASSYKLYAASLILKIQTIIMRNFKELKIWQKGIDIAIKTYQFADTLPKEDKYTIVQQMTKASVSISSNIAEDSSRKSERDYSQFIEISIGSAFELETQIIIVEKLNKGNRQLLQDLKTEVADEQRMLTGFQQKLNL
jgi:four helix bundle protein